MIKLSEMSSDPKPVDLQGLKVDLVHYLTGEHRLTTFHMSDGTRIQMTLITAAPDAEFEVLYITEKAVTQLKPLDFKTLPIITRTVITEALTESHITHDSWWAVAYPKADDKFPQMFRLPKDQTLRNFIIHQNYPKEIMGDKVGYTDDGSLLLFPDGKKKIITEIFQLCDFMYRRGTTTK